MGMKSEKESITAAFAEHFDPMEAGEGKAHFKRLEPFLKKIDIESTLLQALPSSCAKAKDKRGTFDHLVLENLKTAFNAKIAALSQAIEAEGPASIQRASDLAGAEADLTAKTAAREQAASECDAAGKEQSDRESALKAAKQAVEDFQPNLKDTTARLAASEKAFAEFEATPFANFASLKSRVAAVPEAEEALLMLLPPMMRPWRKLFLQPTVRELHDVLSRKFSWGVNWCTNPHLLCVSMRLRRNLFLVVWSFHEYIQQVRRWPNRDSTCTLRGKGCVPYEGVVGYGNVASIR